MLLTITNASPPATDLGFLLHKNPASVRSVDTGFGAVHVFYSHAGPERCTAVLWCELDPVALVRRSRGGMFPLAAYVNDRPYVASSFLAVALRKVYGSALRGQCAERPGLVDERLDLAARLPVLPCRGGEDLLRRLFEPLGYAVTATPVPLAEPLPGWGASPYFDVTVRARCRVQDLLGHLYVLLPVTDGDKHYWVGADEIGKLTGDAGQWLAGHPERELIVRRYLRHQPPLVRAALAQLAGEEVAAAQLWEDDADEEAAETGRQGEDAADHAAKTGPPGEHGADHAAKTGPPGEHGADQAAETGPPGEDGADQAPEAGRPSGGADAAAAAWPGEAGGGPGRARLREERAAAVLAVLHQTGASRVLDLGCGDGLLLGRLLQDQRFSEIVGVDAAAAALERAGRRLRLAELPPRQRQRIRLLQGALTYRDWRLAGYDAAVLMEVIEHIDPGRLDALADAVLGEAAPATVVITTPNAEYNAHYPGLAPGAYRHPDHRFEWDRERFREWAGAAAARYGYSTWFGGIGPDGPGTGPPTQLAVLRKAGSPAPAGSP